MKKILLLFILCPFFLFGQTQIGQDINGKFIGNNSDQIVDISSNGNIIAVGSPLDNGIVKSSGVVRIYENISGTWVQVGSDINGDKTGNKFGSSVSLSSNGDIVAIGAPIEKDSFLQEKGYVKVFKNINGIWTQIGLDINGDKSSDLFGFSVNLNNDGNILAISAPNHIIGPNSSSNSGYVKVYKNIDGVWTQIGENINASPYFQNSGYSLSLSSDGNIIAIGAIENSGVTGIGNGGDSGHVRIYKNINEVWTQIGDDIDGENEEDFSGTSVSLSSDGTIVAIGAANNKGNGSNSGHVRIYKNINDVWTQIGEDIDGKSEEDFLGTSVSLSSDGNTVIIGSKNNSKNGVLIGNVRIYRNINNVWTQVGKDINKGGLTGNKLGSSVSLSSDGTILAIGTEKNDINGKNSGQVQIFKKNNGSWIQLGNNINGKNPETYLGSSVKLSSDGNIVAIGSKSISTNTQVQIYKNINNIWTLFGNEIDINFNKFNSISLSLDGTIVAIGTKSSTKSQVRIFEIKDEVWFQQGQVIYDETSNSSYGENSVSLSSDGSILAIGSPYNNGGGDFSGHVRIFKNIDGVWSQLGKDIDGESSFNYFGSSISLSSDGSIVAIGAIGAKNNNGSTNGHVRIFKNINGIWTQLGEDIDGDNSFDLFGYSLDLSSDGNIVAISSRGFFSGDRGFSLGYVKIYQNVLDTWSKVGDDIIGETQGGGFGSSLSLSSDGSIIAISAPFNSNKGINTGQVKVYDLSAVLSSDSFVLSKFSIFPNPVKNKVTVQLKDNLEVKNISIYNSLGQFIKSSKKLTIDTSTLLKGIYFLQVETDKGKATKKLVIE